MNVISLSGDKLSYVNSFFRHVNACARGHHKETESESQMMQHQCLEPVVEGSCTSVV